MVLAFAIGAVTGFAIAAKKRVDPSTYVGVPAEQAAAGLMDIAKEEAGTGSWENSRVARIYILSGREDEGRAIIDQMTSSSEASDLIRIGRVYFEAGDWDKAKAAFDKAIELAPKDRDWLCEVGAYYNLQDDRETAEGLLQRCFELGYSLKNTVAAAGSYFGVPPRTKI